MLPLSHWQGEFAHIYVDLDDGFYHVVLMTFVTHDSLKLHCHVISRCDELGHIICIKFFP